LLYEKELTSVEALARAIRTLDEDSGVRLIGVREGRECLVFVTRFGRRYTVMTYGMNGKIGAPGKRLDVVEVDGAEAAIRALRGVVPGSVRAFVY